MPYLAKGHRPDKNNGPGVTRIVPTFWPHYLFKLNSNNGPSPSHSNLGSDGRYTCSGLLLMDSWWMPYLPKSCRPDFNNGLGGDLNSGPILATGVYLSPTQIMSPPRATPIFFQVKSSYLFKSPIYDFLVVTTTSVLTLVNKLDSACTCTKQSGEPGYVDVVGSVNTIPLRRYGPSTSKD